MEFTCSSLLPGERVSAGEHVDPGQQATLQADAHLLLTAANVIAFKIKKMLRPLLLHTQAPSSKLGSNWEHLPTDETGCSRY